MTTRREHTESEHSTFTTSVLPWLLAGGMLLLYAVTLDHSTSTESLRQISNLSGLTWQTELAGPVSYLATYPFRWLPPAWIPLVINAFTAICATLTLTLLARSVALLPHDRTRHERQRNPNRLGFLTINHPWLPPVLAVLVCGLQFAFWRNAVAATGEMLDLLLFAYLVRCLLEYRLAEQGTWLLKFALVNGLAVANNWAMVAFLPAFLLAVLWIKGLFNFFNPVFVAHFLRQPQAGLRVPLKLIAAWLAGCSFILLLPFLAAHSRTNHVDFWLGLRFVIDQYDALLFWRALPLRMVFYLCLTSIVPVLFMGIRWGRLIRDAHPTAVVVVNWLFHFVHAFFLFVCLWSVLDSPVSSRRIQPIYTCLPLYYLAALNVGYFSGYFLLVFGDRNRKKHHRENPLAHTINTISSTAMLSLLLLAPAIMLAKNLPEILRARHDAVADYLDQLEEQLPPRGSAILSEDPDRLNGLAIRLSRAGKKSDYLLIDASLLTRFPNYFQFVADKNPQFKISQTLTNQLSEITNPVVTVNWLRDFSRTGGIYFLHPCAGFLTEKFFPQPQGLFSQLHPYPYNLIFPPPLPPELLATNQIFWRTFREEQLPRLLKRTQPPPPVSQRSFWQRCLAIAHILPEPDRSAQLASFYYSVMLNTWGVDLQRNGAFADAGQCFADAKLLNPDNVAAQMNLECNQALQTHHALSVDPAMRVADKLGRNRDWDQSLFLDGPIDEPNACYQLGLVCLDSRMYRQSIQQFARAQRLATNSPDTSLRLAELFMRIGDASNSLSQAARTLNLSPENSRALFIQGLDLIQLQKYHEALVPLDTLLNLRTNDIDARLARGLTYLKLEKLAASEDDYNFVVQRQPKAFPAYYGLADIAHHRKDLPALLKNCELYLANVPPNAPETGQIDLWLKEAKPADTNRPPATQPSPKK